MNIYLTSYGLDIRYKDCMGSYDDIINLLINKRVAIIPNAKLDSEDRTTVSVQRDELLKHDISVDIVDIIKEQLNVNNYDVLFFTGGEPKHLMDAIINANLVDDINSFIKDGGIIIGQSAGAMIFNKDYLDTTSGELLVQHNGFDYSSRMIVPHFDNLDDSIKSQIKDEVLKLNDSDRLVKLYKYIILDFGGVIALPTTGDWDMTPKFMELIDLGKLNINKFKSNKKKYNYILSEHIDTLEQELDMFLRYYEVLLKNSYSNYDYDIVKEIAYDRTYKNDKYKLCDNVGKELEYLKDKYPILMLSDNWPCVLPYMEYNKINNYFDKLYISSIYGWEKKDKVFFDYPIKDYNISEGQALFIDDNETNLDIAKNKGLDVLLMDRYYKDKTSKYKIIHNLYIND